MKYVYLVNTSKGICKITSRRPIDLIEAKNMPELGENVVVTSIYKLNFFEKIVDKLRSK